MVMRMSRTKIDPALDDPFSPEAFRFRFLQSLVLSLTDKSREEGRVDDTGQVAVLLGALNGGHMETLEIVTAVQSFMVALDTAKLLRRPTYKTSQIELLGWHLSHLNLLIEDLNVFPEFEVLVGGDWNVRWRGIHDDADARLFALEVLLTLRASERLHRLRECEQCKQWFLGRTDHQKCCSFSCRQKLHRLTPEFRKQRAKYMRELRLKHKNKLFRSVDSKRRKHGK